MTTFYLDPDETVSKSANFTVTSAATAHEATDDAVRQPTNTGFDSAYLGNQSGFGAESCVLGVESFMIPEGEQVTEVKLWVNYNRNGDPADGGYTFKYNFNLAIYVGATLKAESGNSGTLTVPHTGGISGSGWHPAVVWTPATAPSQSDMDSLRIKIESQLTECCVQNNQYRAAYLEVTTEEVPSVSSESVAGQVVTAEDVSGQVVGGEF